MSDLGRYRKIHVKIWTSPDFLALSAPKPNARDLFFQLLTGKHTTSIPGLFSSGPAALAELLDWPLTAWMRCFKEIESRGMVAADWKAKLVYLPGALKHNTPANPNAVRSWREEWRLLPSCQLLARARSEMGQIVRAMGDQYAASWVAVIGDESSNGSAIGSDNGSVYGSDDGSFDGRSRMRTRAQAAPAPVPVHGSEGVRGGSAVDAETHRRIEVAFLNAAIVHACLLVPPRQWPEDHTALDAFWLDAQRGGLPFETFLLGLAEQVEAWVAAVVTAPKGGWKAEHMARWVEAGATREAAAEADGEPAFVPSATDLAQPNAEGQARAASLLANIGAPRPS